MPKLHRATLPAIPITCSQVDGVRTAPEWIPLFPAGEVAVARDGRTFIPDYQAIIAAFDQLKMSMPIDWDHALDTEGVAPGSSPAAAWVDRIEVRDGIWGHVEVWTARGRESVESLDYRYISPAMFIDDNRRVIGIPRASLVNTPALAMPSLCHEVKSMNETLTRLLAGLELAPETLSDEQVASTLELFSKAKAPAVSLESYIPREQYEAVVGELASTKATLETYQAAQHQERVQRVIKEALSSGRLLPSERGFFEGQAQKDLASVETFLASRSPMGAGSKVIPISSNSADPSGLSEVEKQVAKKGGISLNAFAAAKARRFNNTEKV